MIICPLHNSHCDFNIYLNYNSFEGKEKTNVEAWTNLDVKVVDDFSSHFKYPTINVSPPVLLLKV